MPPHPSSFPPDQIGIVIVDHGSRRADSNAMFCELVRRFAGSAGFRIVEPAHMELAEPSLETAFDRCVERGARLVVIHPYFLLPGRHWEEDIPALADRAASRHPGVRYLVTSPLGLHPGMTDIIKDRVQQCLGHASGTDAGCELCEGTTKCQIR